LQDLHSRRGNSPLIEHLPDFGDQIGGARRMPVEGHDNPVARNADLHKRRKIERFRQRSADHCGEALALGRTPMLGDDPPRVDVARESSPATVMQTD
jgi:hypothetical protein